MGRALGPVCVSVQGCVPQEPLVQACSTYVAKWGDDGHGYRHGSLAVHVGKRLYVLTIRGTQVHAMGRLLRPFGAVRRWRNRNWRRDAWVAFDTMNEAGYEMPPPSSSMPSRPID
jgi:hypothetical protein